MRKVWRVFPAVLLLMFLLTGCGKNPYKEGMEQLEAGQYKEAEVNFKKAVEKEKNLADSCRGLGIACFEQKDYEGARKALKQALNKYGFTAAFGGGRRDEEKSRAKERIFSFRNAEHAWDPKNQRPEMWKLFNTEINKGESIRVFPISNWTEKDIWQYIKREKIEIVPLYFAAVRPVVERDGNLIMVDDERMRLLPGEKPMMKKVRFRTLGCYPLSGGVESDADTLDAIIQETLSAVSSERTSRVIDKDGGAASMEKRKREGYF